MMVRLFDALSSALGGGIALALAAAFAWGVLSILLSPCHLSGVPLIVGFINTGKRASVGRSFSLSSLFGAGILVTIAAIGLLTTSLGRMAGDIGTATNLVVAALFVIIGFYLMDLIALPWEGFAPSTGRRGGAAAFVLGLLFGLGLGPCTFAYMAPVLGVAFRVSSTHPVQAGALVGFFGIGHVAVLVAAGTSTRWVQRYLDWTDGSRTVARMRRVCGLLVVIGGGYLGYLTLWP